MGQNLVNRHLAAEEWTQVDAGIAQAVAALEPVLVPVSATTKKVMVKMGDGSEAFCRRAYGVMLENLQLMPRGFDIEEMRRDLEAHDALNARITTLTRLLEKARNAEMALGSDVMVAALEGYAVLKAVGKGEGINELKKLLGRRFEGGRGRRTTWRFRSRRRLDHLVRSKGKAPRLRGLFLSAWLPSYHLVI